jgi:catecholate siderophore receptor
VNKNTIARRKPGLRPSATGADLADELRPTLLPLVAAMMAGWLGLSHSALAEEEDKTLKAVTVTATQDAPDGYRASKTRVGKVAQDPHDIPQAITTVTRALLDEQDASSLREAMRNVAGLSFNAAEGGRSGDNMNLRGFYTFGDMYLDGVRDTAQYNREVFNLEQVDVLRGAAAMLFGRGQAGGVINQVSKTPMLYGINKVETSVGTDGYLELKADLNQRIGETTALRLNVMNRDEESWRKNPVTGATPEIHRTGVAPSIAFGLGTDHEVTLSHLYVTTRDIADYGVPFDNTTKRVNKAFSKTDFWGLDNNFDDSETNVSTLNYQWKISSDTQLVTKLRNANYKRSYWAGAPGNASNFATGGSAKTRESDTDNFVIQSDFSTRFNALGMKHEFIAGVEYLHEEAQRWSLANVNNAGVYYKGLVGFTNTAGQIVSTAPANQYTGDTYSVYVQDTVEFIPDWKLTAGVRRDKMESDYETNAYNRTTNVLTTTRYSGDFGENSYRVGLSWQPQPEAHYYVSWSDSFSPTADLYQLAGAQYPAERSQVSEIGAKWLLLDGNLAFRTALYRADKEWERSTDLESTAAVLTRKRRTDGIEFELAGRITDNWEVFSGVSVMDPTILKVAPDRTTGGSCSEASPCPVNPNLVGQVARNSPKFTFNLWTTYRLGMGWKVGGGVEHKSKRYGYNPGTDT